MITHILAIIGGIVLVGVLLFLLLWGFSNQGFCSPFQWMVFSLSIHASHHPILSFTIILGIGILIGKFVL